MQTQVYHRYITDDEQKAKTFLLMGALWPINGYLDVDSVEPSFGDLVADRGIEWWACNMFLTGQPNLQPPFGDPQDRNVDLVEKLMRDNQIDSILACSSASLIVFELIARGVPIKKVFIWDCWTGVNVEYESVDEDKKLLDKMKYIQSIYNNGGNPDRRLLNDHLDRMFWPGEGQLKYFPAYGDNHSAANFATGPARLIELSKKVTFKIGFSKNSNLVIRELFPPEDVFYYEDISHWIFIEEGRKRLAKDFCDFVLADR